MRRSAALCALAALLLTPLSGCISLMDREYLVVEEHVEQKSEGFDPDDLTVNSRESLKNAILWLVEAGYEEKVIRVVNYPGDLRADMPRVCYQITDEEPLGAYAINYMSYEITQILTQYTVSVAINYRHTAAQIADIRQVNYVSGLSAELRDALRDFRPALTVEMSYYDPQVHDIPEILQNEYYSNPQWAMGMPEVTVETYPQSGLHRIISIGLTYPDTAENLSFRSRLTDARMIGMVGQLPRELTQPQLVLRLHDIMNERISPALADGPLSGAENTVYGAVAESMATSEGYALAFKRACDMLDISCVIVRGYLNGDPYFWNAVSLWESWYHIDLYSDDVSEGHEYFLRDDVAMEETAYRWAKGKTPLCVLGPLSYERIVSEMNPLPSPSVPEIPAVGEEYDITQSGG